MRLSEREGVSGAIRHPLDLSTGLIEPPGNTIRTTTKRGKSRKWKNLKRQGT